MERSGELALVDGRTRPRCLSPCLHRDTTAVAAAQTLLAQAGRMLAALRRVTPRRGQRYTVGHVVDAKCGSHSVQHTAASQMRRTSVHPGRAVAAQRAEGTCHSALAWPTVAAHALELHLCRGRCC